MKKILSILLVMALLECGAFFAWALAEASDPPAQAAPLVDLTGALVAVAVLIFEFLLGWIARVLIPPLKDWLATHVTEKERGLMWDAICKLVDAAEQTIKGPGLGEKRLAYVEAGLQQRGFRIDDDLIEAAVKQMNDRLAFTVGAAFDVTPEALSKAKDWCDLDENGNPVCDVEK